MSENNICKLNFTCILESKENERLRFTCLESSNKFVYSIQNGIPIDELSHLLKSSKYMLNAFPDFIKDSITDVNPCPEIKGDNQVENEDTTPCPDYSKIKIRRGYIVDDDIYSENLMKSFMESIEPYFEAFEN